MNAWIGVPLLLRERKDQAGKPGADTRKETCRNRPRKLRNWNGATCLVKEVIPGDQAKTQFPAC